MTYTIRTQQRRLRELLTDPSPEAYGAKLARLTRRDQTEILRLIETERLSVVRARIAELDEARRNRRRNRPSEVRRREARAAARRRETLEQHIARTRAHLESLGAPLGRRMTRWERNALAHRVEISHAELDAIIAADVGTIRTYASEHSRLPYSPWFYH